MLHGHVSGHSRPQIILLSWLLISAALEAHPVKQLRTLLITDHAAFFISGATYFLIWAKGLSSTRVAMVLLSWCLATFQSVKALRGFEHHYGTSMSIYVVAGIVTAFFVVMMAVSLSA